MIKRGLVSRSENFIKGKIGENIILRLLRDLGFQVFHNGYEITHTAFLTLTQTNRLDRNKIKKYRARADFIVVKEAENSQNGQCFEVEVKYSSGSYIEREWLKGYDNDVHFIFVDKNNFWSTTKEHLFKDKSHDKRIIHFKDLTLLEDDRFYNFSLSDKSLITDYKRLIGQYFPNVPLKKERTPVPRSKASVPPVYPVNHGKAWSSDLDARLVDEYKLLRIRFQNDKAIALLAEEYRRSPESIRMRLEKLRGKE